MAQNGTKKVFISHAVADAPVIKAFVTLLEAGIGVLPKTIFCTSIKGQGIKPGADFKSSIHSNLGSASTVVALISENFYNSPFCMCELGGVWLQSKDFIPILLPPVRFADMKAVLVGLQALRIESAEDLDELRDELAERLAIDPLPTPRWNEKRDEFLLALKNNLKKIPPSPVVPRNQLDTAKKEISEYEASLKEAQAEIQSLKALNAKLKKAKDAKEVSKIIAEDMEATELFETLCTNVRHALADLSAITRETIFLSELGEEHFLNNSSDYTWDDAKKPIQYKELLLNTNENGVCPNETNKKVKKALTEINKLRDWLGGEAPEEFHDWFSSNNDDSCPDLTDRGFWDTHLW